MTDTMQNIHKLDLPADLEVSIEHGLYEKKHEYQADIQITFNRIHGGGTRVGIHYQRGFAIKIKNTGNEERQYHVGVGILANSANKILKKQLQGSTGFIKPGYTAIVDVELGDKEDPSALILENITVINANGNAVARYPLEVKLLKEANKNGHAPKIASKTTKTGRFLLVALPVAVVLGGLLLSYSIWNDKRNKELKYSPEQEDAFRLADSKMEIFGREAPKKIEEYLKKVTEKRLQELRDIKKTADTIEVTEANATITAEVLKSSFVSEPEVKEGLNEVGMPSDIQVRKDNCFITVMSVEHKNAPPKQDVNSGLGICFLGDGVGETTSMVCFNPQKENKKILLSLDSKNLMDVSVKPKPIDFKQYEKDYQERVKAQLKKVKEMRKGCESWAGAQRRHPAPN